MRTNSFSSDDDDDVNDGDDGGVTFPVALGDMVSQCNADRPKDARIAAEVSNLILERQSLQ